MDMFITHTGERVTGVRLVEARKQVTNDLVELAYTIFNEDAYAPHVTKQQKQDILLDDIKRAKTILNGTVSSLAVIQRINTVLTGECIALLPK